MIHDPILSLGVIFIAGFFGIFERFRLKREIKVLTKQNKGKDKELTSYRNLPIVEDKIREGASERRGKNSRPCVP